MAILDLGFAEGACTSPSKMTDGILVRASDAGSRDIRLVWSTQVGSEAQASFTFSFARGCWRKRTPTMPGDFTGTFMQWRCTLPASQCHEAGGDGQRTWWYVTLDQLSNNGVSNLLSSLLGGSWSYATRMYDGIELYMSVYSTFNPDFAEMYSADLGYSVTTSETATRTLYVNYVPRYEIEDMYYETSSLVVIEYSAEGWYRTDDRYFLEDASRVGSSRLFAPCTWGTVAGRGRIEVPTSALTRHVAGKSAYLEVSFNAAFRNLGSYFTARKTLAVGDRTTANTPTLSLVSASEGVVRIRVGDTGDRGVPISYATVKLDGSGYSFDEREVAPGSVAEFPYCPMGVQLTFTAVGTSAAGGTGSAASLRVAAMRAKFATAASVASGAVVRLAYNPDWTYKVAPECETKKLAGRRWPSTYYGTGGTGTLSFSGAIAEGTGYELMEMCSGTCVVRFPDGGRWAGKMEASLSGATGSPRKYSITLEVGA